VLVVDDDQEMCAMLAEYLSNEQVDVELAHDGEAALRASRRARRIFCRSTWRCQALADSKYSANNVATRACRCVDGAITQLAVALHGDRVVARNADHGGLLVTMTLPRTNGR
jgi:CheY-like chemotaxis protein